MNLVRTLVVFFFYERYRKKFEEKNLTLFKDALGLEKASKITDREMSMFMTLIFYDSYYLGEKDVVNLYSRALEEFLKGEATVGSAALKTLFKSDGYYSNYSAVGTILRKGASELLSEILSPISRGRPMLYGNRLNFKYFSPLGSSLSNYLNARWSLSKAIETDLYK